MAQILPFLRDKLSNVMSGMGTTADKRVYGGYNFVPVTPQQAEASYRSSWLMRKIVDLPAMDMTRKWRAWEASREQITLLEAEEKRLKIRHKVKRALVLSRLWGGGALVMGIEGQEPEDELDVEGLTQGSLKYVHVFSRHQLQTGAIIDDPEDPWYGHPSYYSIAARRSAQVQIHPSRVIAFRGQPAPEGSTMQQHEFWGDPIYQSISDALQNADSAQGGFGALIDEAKVDVISIPDLMKSMASKEYEDRLMARLQAAAAGKSNWRALILDGNEDWNQKQINWAGIPDVIITFLQLCAGAADMPLTRLLGTSPKGLQSTGDGEERDYHSMVNARQDELLQPNLDQLDMALIPSALGSTSDMITYDFVTLNEISPKEQAEIEDKRASAVQKLTTTSLLDSEALGEIVENAMVESGNWPGSEQAFAKARAGDDPANAPENDPEARAETLLPGEADPTDLADARDRRKRKRRLLSDVKFEDGKVRSLYVSRAVVNAGDILAHYEAQGLEFDLEDPDELHVTIIYSTTEIDWMKISPDWSTGPDNDGVFAIPPGGPRQNHLFGPEENVLVLLFNDDHLEWRHKHFLDRGATTKWPDFQPHVTIANPVPTDLDTDAFEPWQGPIVLGPEIFEEVDPDR